MQYAGWSIRHRRVRVNINQAAHLGQLQRAWANTV
jgi:hypothetical protein